jgi:hypothetical protein
MRISRQKCFGIAVATTWALWCATASVRAAVTFDFVAGQPTYSVAPGGTTTVPIYLRETLTGSSISLLASEDGLFSSVAQASRTGTPPSTPAMITGATKDVTNFDDSNFDDTTFAPTLATIGGSRSFNDAHGTPVVVDPFDSNVRRVSIGTVTITAGSAPAETTTFQLADRPGRDDTLTWTNGTILDSQIAPSTFSVVTTPEPSTAIAFAGAAAVAMLIRTPRGRGY